MLSSRPSTFVRLANRGSVAKASQSLDSSRGCNTRTNAGWRSLASYKGVGSAMPAKTAIVLASMRSIVHGDSSPTNLSRALPVHFKQRFTILLADGLVTGNRLLVEQEDCGRLGRSC